MAAMTSPDPSPIPSAAPSLNLAGLSPVNTTDSDSGYAVPETPRPESPPLGLPPVRISTAPTRDSVLFDNLCVARAILGHKIFGQLPMPQNDTLLFPGKSAKAHSFEAPPEAKTEDKYKEGEDFWATIDFEALLAEGLTVMEEITRLRDMSNSGANEEDVQKAGAEIASFSSAYGKKFKAKLDKNPAAYGPPLKEAFSHVGLLTMVCKDLQFLLETVQKLYSARDYGVNERGMKLFLFSVWGVTYLKACFGSQAFYTVLNRVAVARAYGFRSAFSEGVLKKACFQDTLVFADQGPGLIQAAARLMRISLNPVVTEDAFYTEIDVQNYYQKLLAAHGQRALTREKKSFFEELAKEDVCSISFTEVKMWFVTEWLENAVANTVNIGKDDNPGEEEEADPYWEPEPEPPTKKRRIK